MNFTPEEIEVLKAVRYRPAVTVIVCPESKSPLKEEVLHKLKIVQDYVKKQLAENYPENIAEPVLKKLESVISSIDLNSLKKSIAIFVSPIFSKVFHLDIALEEKIIIDESFEIRDMVYARQESLKYLILLITGREAKAFIEENGKMVRLMLDIPEHPEIADDDAERVLNFSDPSKRKEQLLEKFLRHVDGALTDILKVNKFPVFLVGVDRLIGHFKNISLNTRQIADTVHGNYEEASLLQIRNVLKPRIEAWKNQRNNSILKEIDQALGSKKLDTGIEAVWESVNEKNASLLVVEKDFVYPADYSINKKYIHKHEENDGQFVYMKDAVDDIIEKVILQGGEIRFVDAGLLGDYNHIVLIRHY